MMSKRYHIVTVLFCATVLIYCSFVVSAQVAPTRVIEKLNSNWLFQRNDIQDAASPDYDDEHWSTVTVPHDWAITGPFHEDNDKQKVKVVEDGEQVFQTRTGRTGGLPYQGVGWYRKHLYFSKDDDNKRLIFIEFDGAMSNAQIYLNGQFVGERPYGYISFGFDLTPYVHWGSNNVLAVRLQNQPESARWYPGAGIYRAVRLVTLNRTYIPQWGTWITTPEINAENATVNIHIQINSEASNSSMVSLQTIIQDFWGKPVDTVNKRIVLSGRDTVNQVVKLSRPLLWSAKTPFLYKAVTTIRDGEDVLDRYETEFGIRSIRFTSDSGMFVNGRPEKLKGVCLHHDLGALGAAFNKAALRYRLSLLKEMGCNAIRGTHNPHDPGMLELCDEMGFYFIDEAFDEWKIPKVKNGYGTLFDNWAEKDLTDMIRRDRNHPALIMYSIGNELREQDHPEGYQIAHFLTEISHREDPFRPVTAGFNNWSQAIKNGLVAAVDVAGFNYKPDFYARIHRDYPCLPIYGSETASTVSSRGVYHFPAVPLSMKVWENNQSSSYDLEHCNWSQLPDSEWVAQDANAFLAGEFVWTGVDYLGEPTPYNSNWPSRSSYFGIIDLAGIPKDRYYLYKSRWNNEPTLHILPHWTWPGREGKQVPVYVYTNYPEAELFINGESQGRRKFDNGELLNRYRLRWETTIYNPGELKVVAYNNDGKTVDSCVVKTAGKPYSLTLRTNRDTIVANGEDLIYATVEVRDRDGNLCPTADNLINFSVSGNGFLRAVDNGNPASTESFQANYRKAFNGKCVAIVQNNGSLGKVVIRVSSPGLVSNENTLISYL